MVPIAATFILWVVAAVTICRALVWLSRSSELGLRTVTREVQLFANDYIAVTTYLGY